MQDQRCDHPKESVATTSTTLFMGGRVFFMAISGSSGNRKKNGIE